jgi:hypothetical protein
MVVTHLHAAYRLLDGMSSVPFNRRFRTMATVLPERARMFLTVKRSYVCQ